MGIGGILVIIKGLLDTKMVRGIYLGAFGNHATFSW